MVATRTCSACGESLPKSDYSIYQWSKKKDGSKCKACVNANSPPVQEVQKRSIAIEGFAPYCHDGELLEIKHETMESFGRLLRRLERPEAPPHPDMGKACWTPAQTMEITSGGICFGLAHEAKAGAKKRLLTFDETACQFGNHPPYMGPCTHNTVANGKWVAFRLVTPSVEFVYDETREISHPVEKPESRKDGKVYNDEYEAGWFVCHEDIKDPVAEVCQMVYNTFSEENEGNDPYHHIGWSHNTQPHHKELGYVLLARYAMGYNMPEDVTGEEESNIYTEGLFVVDYVDARKDQSMWTNAIRNMHDYGDYTIGHLKYNKDGLCEAFLITGNAVQFGEVYFDGGTSPLGKEEWTKTTIMI